MTSNVKTIPKINGLPGGWPTDKQSRIREENGVIILTHPQREPMKYNPETKKWSDIHVEKSN